MDIWVESLLKKGSRKEGFEMGKSFEIMTFDIIGELAFGENFKGVEIGVEHPWITTHLGALNQGALADALKRFPTLAWLAHGLLQKKIWELTETQPREQPSRRVWLMRRSPLRGLHFNVGKVWPGQKLGCAAQ
ncbi:hypothetical protein QC761_310850 [Podospora bellae-mahoneyi]|uniref:Uncharacterized protein n=1 Tax=Podospora bellae-mahoneyi TaxID=2093777 RepID=A0ABR0FME9_9PEZI|nr:hypothetical protein QC761_310850 [Podospora bellae-mahoneyi]